MLVVISTALHSYRYRHRPADDGDVTCRVPNLASGGARISHGPLEHHRTAGLGSL